MAQADGPIEHRDVTKPYVLRLKMKKLLLLLAFVFFGCKADGNVCSVPDVKDPVGKDSYTALVFGDFGTGESDQMKVAAAMAKTCAERQCDFALVVGDNFYESGVKDKNDSQFQSKFEIPYKDMHFPFYVVLGNHDHIQNAHAQVEYSSERWKMLCEYYPVPNLPDWLNIYGLDSEKYTDDQTAKAKASLCGKDGWKIVMQHHPVYSNGEHGDTAEMKSKVLPMMKECGAQISVVGHDHDLEHIQSSDGLDFFVSGAASKLRGIPTGVNRPGLKQLYAASKLGYGIMRVTQTTFEWDFYTLSGKVYHYSRSK